MTQAHWGVDRRRY